MTIDMRQFYQVFFDEAEELLAEMERLLLGIDVSQPDVEYLNAVFRTAHSVKGGAATFGITDMTEVTHILESLLDKIRQGKMALTTEHVNAFLVAKDVLKMQLDGHRNGAKVDKLAVSQLTKLLQGLLENSVAAQQQGVSSGAAIAVNHAVTPVQEKQNHLRIEFPPLEPAELKTLTEEIGALGDMTSALLPDNRTVLSLKTVKTREDIIELCSFVLDPEDLIVLEQSDEENADVSAAPATGSEQADSDCGYGFFEPLENFRTAKAQPEPVVDEEGLGRSDHGKEDAAGTLVDKRATTRREGDKPANGQESSSIRVSIEKVDQLINLIGELVITQAMIEQRTDSLDPMAHERLLNSVSQLTRNTRELQEAVMSIRMMPMDYVFSRFPRMVRDLAAKLGKKIDFITNGASTELDKGLIERIVDPLTHLVRNSIDHGIEMPEARSAVGKSEAGRLYLSAGHQGGNIVIEVCDDGDGLNRDRILAKAKQQGLAVSDQMTDGEVWQLIFAPGFSTAEIVTDVSGRGVGMDVVKRNIMAMGGSVEIQSAKGFGTTITISLPLTLAILDGMSIKVGEEVYILPLGFVIESLQPAAQDIKKISGKGSVVKVRGEYLPLISLYQVFDINPRYTDPSQGIVVILDADGKKAGLLIDELVGQQQVVVKNLESNYRKVAGISGATILGDGGVSLILDVSAILRSSQQSETEAAYF